jgi:hypothetical protein
MSSNKHAREEHRVQVSTVTNKTEKGSETASVSLDAVLQNSSWLSKHFVCFLDIPTLGRCAQVSKTIPRSRDERCCVERTFKSVRRGGVLCQSQNDAGKYACAAFDS